MTTIRASCGDCGDVELTTTQVRVRICQDDERATYSFVCPRCRLTVVKATDDRAVQLLLDAGVDVTRWTLPLELVERPVGPPIDHDDLLDFHRLLNQEHSWFDELLRLVDR